MQTNIHKSLIRDFYRRAVNQGDLAFADQLIADNYIQHSPALKPGKGGLMEALQLMKQMPKPAATSTPFFRLIAEGDFVVTNLSFDWGGKQKVVVDLFRFENGKVIEHWDAVQDEPATSANGHDGWAHAARQC
jgi:predicted SnoaL-like aldol condensation-catalyzing enzyme